MAILDQLEQQIKEMETQFSQMNVQTVTETNVDSS